MQKSSIIKMMEDAVLKAGRVLARDFGEIENLQVSRKGPLDFVTSADRKSEDILIKELQKVRPDYGFLVEERGEIKGKNEKYRWIADPLDGTINFMHALPNFSISLALEETSANGKKDIVAGIVYAPVTREIYLAEKGAGAFLGNRRLRVSVRDRLEDALLVTSFDPNQDETNGITAMLEMGFNTRIFNSSALDLAYLAAGKIDVFWHNRLKPWDCAAGILLVREARGIVTEINGGSNMLESGSVLAGNEILHEKISSTLAKYYAKKTK